MTDLGHGPIVAIESCFWMGELQHGWKPTGRPLGVMLVFLEAEFC